MDAGYLIDSAIAKSYSFYLSTIEKEKKEQNINDDSSVKQSSATQAQDQLPPRSPYFPRMVCCGTKKRKFYCPTCYSLICSGSPPPPPSVDLPFNVDVILHDEPDVATSIHLKVLSKKEQVKIINFETDEIPIYTKQDFLEHPVNQPNNDKQQNLSSSPLSPPESSTYILFPCKTSVPLSSLPPPSKLVVLDCKWFVSPHFF